MTTFSPREIVSELDRYIVGQNDAKRAVAIALRNRWRRQQLEGAMSEEVLPKNILMIGPTGCGKTEISRRLARLAGAPFLKVEATKFTEVGYVGRDVEQIVRDLVEIGIGLVREEKRRQVEAKAHLAAEERVLDALVGPSASADDPRELPPQAARERARRQGDRDRDRSRGGGGGLPMFEIPGMPGASVGAINLGDMIGKAFGGGRPKTAAHDRARSLRAADQRGIRQAPRPGRHRPGGDPAGREQRHRLPGRDRQDLRARGEGRIGADVSREGVQRDLLPLIEGTTVATKHGPVKTDHILFIASGAFHVSKPSDLLPELQGRLPIRVELAPLTVEDFRRILTETEASLIKQTVALMETEGRDGRPSRTTPSTRSPASPSR